MAPFRRVAQAVKQIVKARKPQSCALFSSQILRFSSRCPAFCSCVPVLCSGGQPFYFRWSGILPLVARHSASRGSPSAPAGPAFCLRLPAILPPLPRTLLPQHILSPQRVTLPFPILLFSSQRSVLRSQSPIIPHPGQHLQYLAHKNLDFVLEKAENEGSRPQKRTKNQILWVLRQI